MVDSWHFVITFSWVRTIFFLHSFGNWPFSLQNLNIISEGFKIRRHATNFQHMDTHHIITMNFVEKVLDYPCANNHLILWKYSRVRNKQGGSKFCSKKINGLGGKTFKTFALLLTVVLMKVLKRLKYKTKSMLVS